MTSTIFIDGEAGTTGLQIRDKLAGFAGIALRSLPAELRKDPAAKLRLYAEVDLVILCLPDEAAKETAKAIEGMGAKAPRMIDASSAHRVAPGWVYGFPELAPGQGAAIASARLVTNPGCHATGAIALIAPLTASGLIAKDFRDLDQFGQRLFGRRQGDDRSVRERPRAELRALRAGAAAQAPAGDRTLFGPRGEADLRAVGRQFPPGHDRQRPAASRRAAGQAEGRRPARRARRALRRARNTSGSRAPRRPPPRCASSRSRSTARTTC